MTNLELFQKALQQPFISPQLFSKVRRQKWGNIIYSKNADSYGVFKIALAKHDIGPLDEIEHG